MYPNKFVTKSGREYVPYVPPPPPPPVQEPIRTITVPETGRFMVLRDDWETARWGNMPRSRYMNYKKDPPWNALPATIPMTKTFYALNEAWQRFYFALIHKNVGTTMTDADLLAGYKATTRDAGGWRDRHTWNNVKEPDKIYTDYVLGYNLSGYTDAAQQDLLSSGNIVKVIGEGQVGGEAAWVIETLDPFKPPPSIDDVWGKWWLVGWCTLSAYDWDRNVKARLRWPFFNGYGCPLMLLGRDGKNLVPKSWCKPVANGATVSLYTV